MAKAKPEEMASWREWAKAVNPPPLTLSDPGPFPRVEIKNREDVDLALKAIGETDQLLSAIESKLLADVNAAKEEAVADSKAPLKWKKSLEKELGKYAEKDKANWDGKTLVLNFGKLFFHKGTGAIKFFRSIEWVLAAIKAKGWTHLIRTVEEPNKDAMGPLDDAQLKEIGGKREKEERFHYEVFKPEVKS